MVHVCDFLFERDPGGFARLVNLFFFSKKTFKSSVSFFFSVFGVSFHFFADFAHFFTSVIFSPKGIRVVLPDFEIFQVFFFNLLNPVFFWCFFLFLVFFENFLLIFRFFFVFHEIFSPERDLCPRQNIKKMIKMIKNISKKKKKKKKQKT